MMKLELNEPRVENHGEKVTLTIDSDGERVAVAELAELAELAETVVSHAFSLTTTHFTAQLTEAG